MKTNKHVKTLVKVNKRLKIIVLYAATACVAKAVWIYYVQPQTIDININRGGVQILVQKARLFH